MICLNKRQENLLTTLLLKEEFINVNKIANDFECSERTIRNDCKYIDEWLSTFCNAYIKRKPNIGIKFSGDGTDKILVNQKLRGEVKRVNSELHKQVEILNLLLCNNKKVTLNDLSNKLYINKNIVREEISKLSVALNNYNLNVSTKKGSGIYIEGDEKDIRIMLVSFLFKYIDKYRLNIDEIEYFHIVDIIIVKNIMLTIEEDMDIRLTDISFKQLMLFLLINIIRIRLGNSLKVSNTKKELKLKMLILDIEDELKSNLSIVLNYEEKLFIESLILGMNKQINSNNIKKSLYLNEELASYTKKIINLVSEESGINFNNDILLYEQLICHLNVTMHQMKSNVYLENPLLDNIKTKFCFLFTVISSSIEIELKGKQITEDEIGYLTLHFQTSLERKYSKRESNKKASIVCPFSFGVNMLLKVKIEKRFDNIKIIETLREEDLKRDNFNKTIDFIIAFQEYENIQKPIFITTPLFTDEDENKLKEFTNKIKEKDTSYKLMNRLMMSDYLIRELEHDDIYEAITYLTNLLIEKHYAEKEYLQSIITREKSYPTNVGKGILFPHGDMKYIKQSVLCFARLKTPIKIRNGKDIKIILLLAYKKDDDRKVFRELFKEISNLTEDENMLDILSKCDIEKVKDILI
ncbi:TPA: transcription antiterminator [Clostridioides difficile]|nr:transcription antiterminator [Clostridioides difficile]